MDRDIYVDHTRVPGHVGFMCKVPIITKKQTMAIHMASLVVALNIKQYMTAILT